LAGAFGGWFEGKGVSTSRVSPSGPLTHLHDVLAVRVVLHEHGQVVARHRQRARLSAHLHELDEHAQHLVVLLLELGSVLAPEGDVLVDRGPVQAARQHLLRTTVEGRQQWAQAAGVGRGRGCACVVEGTP
jgi:hypothetical protein